MKDLTKKLKALEAETCYVLFIKNPHAYRDNEKKIKRLENQIQKLKLQIQ